MIFIGNALSSIDEEYGLKAQSLDEAVHRI
jgi:hypothetical protein